MAQLPRKCYIFINYIPGLKLKCGKMNLCEKPSVTYDCIATI